MTHKVSVKKEGSTPSTMAAMKLPDKGEADALRSALLGWYDWHRRALPWRAPVGSRADPYLVWLSEIMLQQTTVGVVIPYFEKFRVRWPRIADLAAAPDTDVMAAWAGLGYYSRARNLLKCAQTVALEHQGDFPQDYAALKDLPGIGDYTASAIMAIAFGRPASVIDGNVERVVARVFAIEEPLPGAKMIIRRYVNALSGGRTDRPGDFAQGMMDLGATVCVPGTPRCDVCPLKSLCAAHKLDLQKLLPRRSPRPVRPKRTGYVYWIHDGGGRIMLCRRPDSGLLGGMAALPTSAWLEDDIASTLTHPSFIVNTEAYVEIRKRASFRHVFTHFELKLIPATLPWPPMALPPEDCYWADLSAAESWGLPSVFKKTVRAMANW